jgi:hypothetical protein
MSFVVYCTLYISHCTLQEVGEEPERKKARMGEEKYQRFKESSRWLAEANPAGCG